MTKDEYDALVKATENYRKQKIIDEETRTLNDFEDLKQSYVYRYFKYIAIFGILFSAILFMDYYSPFHLKKGTIQNVTIITTEKEDSYQNIKYVISNSEIDLVFNDKSTSSLTLNSDVSNLLKKGTPVEVMQTAIFKIDVGLKRDFLVYDTNGSQFRTFHWFIISFNLCLILLTFITKGPTPLYYIVINTTFFGVSIISGLFLIYVLFN